ncbi:MAG: metal-sensitive transcriptional regulator [Patescibacteria group bacterium]|nr:metal-sensitive transcriptional regulator [Patescibacteria group bacterium]
MEISKRINRIIGQLRGIEKMVSSKRDCVEILQQVSAVKKAIDGLTKEILVSQMCQIVPKEKEKEVEKMIERAISL